MLRKLLYLLVYSALIAIFGWQSAKIRFSNDNWLPPPHPVRQASEYLQDEFAPGEDLLIAIRLQEEYFSETLLDALGQLTEVLADLADVRDVNTPLEATTILRGSGQLHTVSFEDALDKGYLAGLEAYREKLTESVYYGRLISKDYKNIAVVLNLKTSALTDDYYPLRERVMRITEEHLAKYPAFSDWRFSGETRLYFQLDLGSRRNLAIFLPLLGGLIVCLLLFLFRSISKTLIILSSTTAALLFTFSVISWMEHPLTLVGISLPVLILVIAIADSIHIVTRWDQNASWENERGRVLRATMHQTWLPCLMTSFTTAIGFGSFAFSEVLPLSHLGTDAFLSIFGVFFLVVGLNWAGLYLFQRQVQSAPENEEALVRRFSRFCYNLTTAHAGKIVLVTGVLSLLSLAALTQVYFETNFLDVFFKRSSPTYQSFRYVDRHLGGSGAMDLIFRGVNEDDFKRPRMMQELHRLENRLVTDQDINYVQSYRNPVQLMYRQLSEDDQAGLPQTERSLEQTILFLEFSRGAKSKDVLSPYVDFTYENARLHLQTPNLNSTHTEALFKRVQRILPEYDLPSVLWTGSNVYFQALSELVLNTQVASVGMTLLLIYVLFLFIFRFRLGTLGMLTNVIPVLMTCGLIAALRVPFDFATVLITSVSFGLCVDDTIHFVHHYHHQRWQSTQQDPTVWIGHTLRTLARPLVFTTILFCIGFAVFLVSDFIILIKFGTFTIFALVAALLANMLFLPACLQLGERKRN